MRTVAHSGLPQRCQAVRSRRTSSFEGRMKASSQISTLSLRRRCLRGSADGRRRDGGRADCSRLTA
eukprot:3242306-Prymnesium_polylepis.1